LEPLMARSCTICASALASTINGLLAEGRSARSVAAEMGLSSRALQRHAANHGDRTVAPSVPESAVPESAADPLDELVAALRVRALAGNPADTREYRLALAAQSAARHATAPRRSLVDEPEWAALRTRLLSALQPFPEAAQAVADALEAS
jgi:hypothetical protein